MQCNAGDDSIAALQDDFPRGRKHVHFEFEIHESGVGNIPQ